MTHKNYGSFATGDDGNRPDRAYDATHKKYGEQRGSDTTEVTFKKFSITQLQRHIRAAAKHPDNLFLTLHAKARMHERGIHQDEILQCLQRGRINRRPEEDLKTGHLVCRMDWYGASWDLAVCVALDDDDPQLIVVTVIA